MQQYEPHSLKERLLTLYCEEDASKALEAIEALIASYAKTISSIPHPMTQKDVILITYADQVQRPTEPPLESLQEFLEQELKGIINSVHILPFYPYSSDDGFSVVDYKEVDPHFGSWKEITGISENFRLMVDGVINHASQYSAWFKGFLEGDPEYARYFIEMDPSVDLSQVVRPRATPLLHEFSDPKGHIHYIWTTFSKDQVDLNYANYHVLISVLDALFFYIEQGATLIRLDAIAFVWKKVGTACVHLEETHELIQLMREVLHELAPEVVIITETNVPHHENISYFGSGDDEAQMVYNFALPPLIAHSILCEDASTMTTWAKSLHLPSDKVCFFNFTASHDGVGMRPVSDILSEKDKELLVKRVEEHGGLLSYRSDENGNKKVYELNCSYIDILSAPDDSIEVRAKRMLLSQAIALAMPGVPGIYFHSLVGSSNDFSGVKRTGINRSINREKLNIDYLYQALQRPGSIEQMLFNSYKRLISIRINEQAFNPFGSFEILSLHPKVFAILQKCCDGDEDILALHNVSAQEITIELPEEFATEAFDLITLHQYAPFEHVHLAAYGIQWLKAVQ